MENSVDVNNTHICVLKKDKNSSNVNLDFIPIIYPDKFETDSFEDILSKGYNNIKEIIDFIKNNRKDLVKLSALNYCSNIGDKYQDIVIRQIYLDKLVRSIEEKDFNHVRNLISSKINKYKEAKIFQKNIKEISSSPNTIMYSHRYHGWTTMNYSINNSFKAMIKSNFGYGMSSYFFTILEFENICLAPFSYWIKYRYAMTHEIINYSKKHFLQDNSWIESMEFIQEVIHDFNTDLNMFLQKYLIDECENLVEGLEFILNETIFEFYESKIKQKKISQQKIVNQYYWVIRKERLKGRELDIFRANKITGALEFINAISKYDRIISVQRFINKIEFLNEKLYPKLLIQKNRYQYQLESVNESYKQKNIILEREKLKYQTINEELETFIKSKENLEELKKNDRNELVRLFSIKNPNYGTLEKKYNNLKKEVFELLSLSKELDIAIEKMSECILNYEQYFELKT